MNKKHFTIQNNDMELNKNLGFVGIIMGENPIKMKSCILKNASQTNLLFLINYNLDILDEMLDYLIKNDIRLFRVSSGAIPFASHEINMLNWCEIFKEKFKKIGQKAQKNHIRLSMHPGQYSVLNSNNENLTVKAIKDLEYHTKFLDCLGLNSTNKVILHIGGVYGDKKSAINRFVKNYKKLSKAIKKRLVIENDDKNYTVSDVLEISKKTGAPVVFDYFHYLLNHYDFECDWVALLSLCRKTWKKKDGNPKIHYSQASELSKHKGAHSLTIEVESFAEFYNQVSRETDIMLEVKDKNLSTLKCKNKIQEML